MKKVWLILLIANLVFIAVDVLTNRIDWTTALSIFGAFGSLTAYKLWDEV